MLEQGVIVVGYRIEGVLGRGGMGVVYEATQLSLDRTVALKLISDELGVDPGFRERFRQEGKIQAAMEHPHIVTVHEAGESEHGLFIAMRLIRGRNLKDLIVAGELDPPRTTRLLSQVAGALDTAHEAGLIHRDIKPSNVLVQARRDHAYLADFGAIKVRAGVSLTATGQLVGTPDYMAPEQILGQPATERTDIYAFGAVLYECLTGRIPYERDTDLAVLYAHLNEPAPSVTKDNPRLPPALDDVIGRAMAKAPEERYPNAGELLSDVERALERGEAGATVPAGRGSEAVVSSSPGAVPAPIERVSVGASVDSTGATAAHGGGVAKAGIELSPQMVAGLAVAGAVLLLAATLISFTPSFAEWNVFAVFSPVEAVGVALAVAAVARASLTNRVHASLAAGLLLGFGLVTSVGAITLVSFALRRHETPERLASVAVLIGAIAILAAGLACMLRQLATRELGRVDVVALGLGAAGILVSSISLFVDYDGFSSLVDELSERESAEFFFEPAFAIGVTFVALLLLAGSSRSVFASGLILAAGAQSALHFLGLILAAALAVGERGEVRAGGFVGLVGSLLVVAAGLSALRSSMREAATSPTVSAGTSRTNP